MGNRGGELAIPRRRKGSEATRQRLRDAAWAVFRAQGIEGTTVRAIAAAADCAVGGLYTYYPNKDSLLEDLTLSALAELGREVAAHPDKPAIAAVTEAMRTVFGPGAPAASLLMVLFRPGQTGGTEFARRVAGRILTALAPLAAAGDGQTPQAAAANALAASSFAFGLVLFESSGLLAQLGGEAEAVVQAFRLVRRG